jgi:hypothetical protein
MTGDGADAALILLPAASTVEAAGDRFTGELQHYSPWSVRSIVTRKS